MQNNQSEYSCYYGGTNSKNGTEEIVSEEATSTSIDTIHHAMLIAKCGFFATNDRTWFLYDFAAKGVSITIYPRAFFQYDIPAKSNSSIQNSGIR